MKSSCLECDGDKEQNTDNGDTPIQSSNEPGNRAGKLDALNQVESGSSTDEKNVFNVGWIKGGENQINFFSAVCYFYNAPASKFCTNVAGYLVFLGMFSFFILTDLRPVNGLSQLNIFEWFVWFWIGTMILEEIQQLFTRDDSSWISKLRSWFFSDWNAFDLVMFVSFLTSFVLRLTLTEDKFSAVRIAYSITLTLCFLRSLQYFYITPYVGPKVIMISKMLADILFFCMILFLFLVSFGVAYHANLYPNSALSWSLVKGVFYIPYWQMYGELFLEVIEGRNADTCTHNASIYNQEGGMARCAESTYIVPFFLAVYMIVTHILLVNLLIAMFSYIFQKVQENSEKVWHFNRYSLVYEYAVRREIVPPLVILSFLLWVVRKIFKWPGKRCPNAFRRKLVDDRRMTIFERSAMEECTIAVNEGREKIDTQVSNDRTSNNIAQMKSCINDLNVKLEKQGGQLEKLGEQLQKQEEHHEKQWGQLEQLNSALNHFHQMITRREITFSDD